MAICETSEIVIIHGSPERIIYMNQDNGYYVVKLSQDGGVPVTVVGNTPNICVFKYVEIEGYFYDHPDYGTQFKATFIRPTLPTSLEGVKRYLVACKIEGVGEVTIGKIVDHFGNNVFEVIKNNPEKLMSVPGVGTTRAKSIKEHRDNMTFLWSEDQENEQKIMCFLLSSGVNKQQAEKIYGFYGKETMEKLSENPYVIVGVKDIGFKLADKIAMKLGVAKDSGCRAKAGLNFILTEQLNGHCGSCVGGLLKNAEKLLQISGGVLSQALEEEINAGNMVKDFARPNTKVIEAIFNKSIYDCEKDISKYLKILSSSPPPWKGEDKCAVFEAACEGKNYGKDQKDAIRQVLDNKVMIITGGPGTGKTTVIKAILQVLEDGEIIPMMCAPTGRAAKRLHESTQVEAVTIHRLLGFRPGGFIHHAGNRLPCDAIIVDETSMVDIHLMRSLVSAIPDAAMLILVGDADQLPSIGPGQVFKDMINSGVIYTVKLTENFRQDGGIISNARLINEGLSPDFRQKLDDFRFVEVEDNEDVSDQILTLVNSMSKTYGLDPRGDVQILTPTNVGADCGAKHLNIKLQKHLNSSEKINMCGQLFGIGDKVMHIKNNYDKGVFNGDIGFVEEIRWENDKIIVNFEGELIEYCPSDINELVLAYAITIHKSQGSEYPAVIMPILADESWFLSRKMLYTAITRGKRYVYIIGRETDAVDAINNALDKTDNRVTKLRDFLIDDESEYVHPNNTA